MIFALQVILICICPNQLSTVSAAVDEQTGEQAYDHSWWRENGGHAKLMIGTAWAGRVVLELIYLQQQHRQTILPQTSWIGLSRIATHIGQVRSLFTAAGLYDGMSLVGKKGGAIVCMCCKRVWSASGHLSLFLVTFLFQPPPCCKVDKNI